MRFEITDDARSRTAEDGSRFDRLHTMKYERTVDSVTL